MADASTILAANLSEALKQANNYLTIGLATAVSAYAIDRRTSSSESTDVAIPGVPIAVAPATAKMLLLGLCWLAGAMASYAVEAANDVAVLLSSQPDILHAACRYPSLATAPVGYGIAATVLPVAFAWRVLWPIHKGIHAARPGENTSVLFLVFLIPYGAVAFAMRELGCR